MFRSRIINGRELATIRFEKGFHAADDLARKIGRASGTVRRWESQTIVGIDPDIFRDIAEAMKMDGDALWERIGVKSPPPRKSAKRRVVLTGEAADLLLDTASRHEMDVHVVAVELIRAGILHWSPSVPDGLGEGGGAASEEVNGRDHGKSVGRA